jgi:hypothetical protein
MSINHREITFKIWGDRTFTSQSDRTLVILSKCRNNLIQSIPVEIRRQA